MKNSMLLICMMPGAFSCNQPMAQPWKAFAFARVVQGGAQMVDDNGNPVQQQPAIHRFLLLAVKHADIDHLHIDSIIIGNERAAFTLMKLDKPDDLTLDNGEVWQHKMPAGTRWLHIELGQSLLPGLAPGTAQYLVCWHKDGTTGKLGVNNEMVLLPAAAY